MSFGLVPKPPPDFYLAAVRGLEIKSGWEQCCLLSTSWLCSNAGTLFSVCGYGLLRTNEEMLHGNCGVQNVHCLEQSTCQQNASTLCDPSFTTRAIDLADGHSHNKNLTVLP